MRSAFIALVLGLSSASGQAQERDTLYLWPGAVPGEAGAKHPPVRTPNNDRGVTRLTDVTDPALVVFRPDPARANGAGVVVCPGGGYSILAIDIEGYEVAAWLNSLGYTAFVLQYRVPQKREGALQDVQRAMSVIRSRAAEWKLQPNQLGVLGFSAGGSLGARASTRYRERTYAPVDAHDRFPTRPDFALLIYPAYLDQGEGRSLTPELKVDRDTPPVFLFGTADDSHGNSVLVMAAALRDARVPVEVHLLPSGGHGYGLRRGNPAAELWPTLAEVWLRKVAGSERQAR